MTIKILEKSGEQYIYENRISKLLAENPTIALVCGYHVAGALHRSFFCEDYNPQWALLGDSSIGKTLALKTAMSLGQDPNNLRVLDSLSENIETHFKAFDNVGGIADESLTFGSRNQVVALLKEFSHGHTHHSETHKPRHCRFTFLLSSEDPIPPAIVGDLHLKQTVFDSNNSLWTTITTKDEAQAWLAFISSNYGHVYPQILSRVHSEATHYHAEYEEIKKQSNLDMTLSSERKKAHEYALAMTGVKLLASVLNFQQYVPTIENRARQLFL